MVAGLEILPDARARRFANIFRNAPESVLRSCIFAWHPRMGTYATLGPKYGYQRLAGTYSGGARMVRDRWAGIYRSFPANTMPITGVQEPAVTNLFKSSQDFSDAIWTGAATVTPDIYLAPDGTTTADQIAAGGTRSQVQSFAADTTYTFSLFLKPKTTAEVPGVTASFYDGTNFVNLLWRHDILDWGLAGGTLSWTNGGQEALPNGWYRIFVTITASAAATGGSFSIYIDSVSGVNDWYFWGIQIEENDYHTSYVRTTSDPVARAADAFRFTSTLFDSVKSQGSLLVVMRAQHDVVDLAEDVGYIALTDSGDYATDGIRAAQLMSGDGELYVESYQGGTPSQSNVNQAPAPAEYNALAFSWDANGGDCFRVLSGASASLSLAWLPSSLDGLEIGSDASANARNGFDYALAAVFDRPLTEAELVSLTLNPERYVAQAA